MAPDWRIASHYALLARAERKALAWEWLRRSDRYRQIWSQFKSNGSSELSPYQFGMERFEDPGLATPFAKPIWRADVDPSVITASISGRKCANSHHIDLFVWRDFASIFIDPSANEHILLSDGLRTLRLDIMEGTLLGCSACLTFMLGTNDAMRSQIQTLNQLFTMTVTGRFDHGSNANRILDRWIAELRVADALRCNASHYEIARVLFGPMISKRNWRSESAPYRLRVQRLARQARRRLKQPLDRAWFT